MSASPPKAIKALVWAELSWWSRRSGRRALEGLLRGEVLRFAASVGLASASLLAATALLGTSAWLLASAALRPSIAELQLAIVGVRALGLGRGVLRYLERLMTHDITLRLLARLRSSVFRALASARESPTLGRGSGEIQARAVEDVAALEGVTVRILVPTAAGAAACVVVVSVLWTRGAWVGLAVLAGLLFAGCLVPVVVARRAAEAGRRLADAAGHLTAALVDSVQGAADILVFGRAESQAREVEALARAHAKDQLRLARLSAAGSAVSGLVADLTAALALAAAVALVRGHELSGVQLAVVVLVTLAAFEAVSPLPAAFHAFGQVVHSARRVTELLRSRPRDDSADLARERPHSSSDETTPVFQNEGRRHAATGSDALDRLPGVPVVEGDGALGDLLVELGDSRLPTLVSPEEESAALDIRHLTFGFTDEPKPLFENVSVRVVVGERVALVGPSGSGKSTLARIAAGLLQPPPGVVWVGGRDIVTLDSEALPRVAFFSAQDAHIFTGSLRSNVVLARETASEAALDTALQVSGLGSVVAQWSEGLDTAVGEQGVRLSGGERERVVLARALVSGAKLLLLDEPTAHLDVLAEREVFRALLDGGEALGLLLITHRVVALGGFDRIVVLDEGRVVETGTPAELEASGGLFSRMLALQRSVEALGDAVFRAGGLRPTEERTTDGSGSVST